MGSCFYNFSHFSCFLLLISHLYFVKGEHVHKVGKLIKTSSSGCDHYDGKWVFDYTYPLYNDSACPFIEKEFACLRNRRPDKLYLKYRWKPNACELPRFNGRDFLRQYRGKSIMFVGDSLNMNQWQSLTCILHTSVPWAKYTLVRTGGLSTFTILDYKIKVMFSRNAFLVDIVEETIGRVMKLDSIEAGKEWEGMDMLIFNTWHWWLHTGRKQPWDHIKEGNKMYKDIDRLVAYEKALTTWGKWVDTSIDPTKTRVFFQGVSPDHDIGTDWGQPYAKHCFGQMVPFNEHTYPGGPHPAEIVVKRVLSQLSKPVYLLDVTKLSQLRKDGHPSAYGFGGHRFLDCTHWCLAGVPDTWNQLLYAAL